MTDRFDIWKVALERLRSTAAIDWNEAGRLAAEIARGSSDATLRHAAAQAVPILRQAALDPDNREITIAARRRLGVLFDVLHDLVSPKFGRRGALPKPLSQEQHARKTLGLPDGAQLTCDDIHRAFRHAAKTLHPDAGGSEDAFRELAAARDILIHPGAHKEA
ncbi:MAG: J domain-containing protein [Bradyrhizobium sp.]|uniref:J domain-containing protein n=1 Tax=Bradyrhizobium sp. TaxID=376 RepID=UPI0025C46B07|nr:J domain-containing protein [Bradyrhizobium sp.]MBI5265475.1 J domain-containing protein [Bradyrhizobium sp.]